MVFFGGLLALIGLVTLVFRDGDVAGVPAVGLGVVLLVLGAAAVGLGLWRKQVVRRRRRERGEPEPVGDVFERAKALPRLIRAARRGEYPGLPTSRMALWGFAVLYLVSPIDVLPELLPIIGVADDAGVAAWLFTSVSTAAGLYLRHERDQEKRLRP
ncbi:YkvA family protein [Kribbella sp. NPDC051770]|uniref:YkvA family protein n=1 Tax=Kribbella sp. NPDC051770 TaxID=3155413 RepID=UPI0034295576